MMDVRIETLTEKKLMGKHMAMSFADNKTAELWRSFMPRRKDIKNAIGNDFYSMQVYAPGFFRNFDPQARFEKWAAVAVPDFHTIPDGMETYRLPGGLYAVFLYKGAASAAGPAFHYIHNTWLPASEYELDSRPHFEILGDKYKNDDPASEEELWIPIRARK